MERTRLTGALIMAAAAIEVALFLYGLARRSYTALALPVAALVLTAAALCFWVGWTLLEAEDDLEGLEFAPEPLDDV